MTTGRHHELRPWRVARRRRRPLACTAESTHQQARVHGGGQAGARARTTPPSAVVEMRCPSRPFARRSTTPHPVVGGACIANRRPWRVPCPVVSVLWSSEGAPALALPLSCTATALVCVYGGGAQRGRPRDSYLTYLGPTSEAPTVTATTRLRHSLSTHRPPSRSADICTSTTRTAFDLR
jgi:hypothetical protein